MLARAMTWLRSRLQTKTPPESSSGPKPISHPEDSPMGDLSPHFSKHEFRSRDGAEHPIDPKLIEMLERIRAHFNAPTTIVSGYRSPEHNRKVGGARISYHVQGMEADIQVRGVSPAEVYRFCDAEFQKGGVGKYSTFTHIDCRGYKARW